ncbi:hypothetical protein BGZ94_003124 [Podila epigama]|nr:hypothetical protein BGZ94_003124 [Podila epigama]
MRQREQTLEQLQSQEQLEHHKNRKTQGSAATTMVELTENCRNNNKPSLAASRTLSLLIHKQSLEIENVLQQLYETISVFQSVVRAMLQLERQVEATIERIEPSKLLASIHNVPKAAPFMNAATSTRISYASEPSMIETAEIGPLEVLDWVTRVRMMYAQELDLKRSQIHPGMTALDRFESLAELQRSWGLQKRIDFGLEQEIVERIKAYRRVREFSSRT